MITAKEAKAIVAARKEVLQKQVMENAKNWCETVASEEIKAASANGFTTVRVATGALGAEGIKKAMHILEEQGFYTDWRMTEILIMWG